MYLQPLLCSICWVSTSLSFIYLYHYRSCLNHYAFNLNQVLKAYSSSCFGTFESEDRFKDMIPTWKNRAASAQICQSQVKLPLVLEGITVISGSLIILGAWGYTLWIRRLRRERALRTVMTYED